MMFYCYILYSKSLDLFFYIAETEDVEERLRLHNSEFFKGSYTCQVSDWEILHTIKCISRTQARCLEYHIKKMKSRKYIENLRCYPDITKKLLERYK